MIRIRVHDLTVAYNEMKIEFYPTYKREAKSGMFSLSKDTKGGLAEPLYVGRRGKATRY